MAICKHPKTKIIVVMDDAPGGDIERTVCAMEECGYILKEEHLVERPDGSRIRRSRRVDQENQPDDFKFANKDERLEDRIMSASEMLMLAVKTREETVGKRARELAKVIIDQCAEHVLLGEYRYNIEATSDLPAEIISLAVKELKEQGYKVMKEPVPGEGIWIQVKWPTKVKQAKKIKGSKEKEIAFEVGIQATKQESKQLRSAVQKKKRVLKSQRADLQNLQQPKS